MKPHPISRASLKSLPTLSTRLKQCIELFAANTVGIGWDTLPATDFFEDPESKDEKKRAEVAGRKLRRELNALSGKISFTRLMKKVKMDQETFGDGYLEVIRELSAKIALLNHVDSSVMFRREDELGWVQVRDKKQSYFVDYKSNLVVDRKTGEVVGQFVGEGDERKIVPLTLDERRLLGDMTAPDNNPADTDQDERGRDPIGNPAHRANEVIQFKIDSVQSQFYGMPRHTPAVTSIVGNNLAERRNVVFFDNDATPRMVVIVHGGQLNAETTANLRTFLERGSKGVGKAPRVLVLESEPNAMGGVSPQDAKIELKPLTVGTTDDASFLKYILDNERRIREAFGIAEIFFSPIISNRAAAFVSRAITNEQVFTPDRLEWEFSINDMLWSEDQFGAKNLVLLRFLSPDTTDDEVEARVHATLSSAGAATPNDGRRRFEMKLFDKDEEGFDFADIPQPVWLARLAAEAKGETGTDTKQSGEPEPNRTEAPDVRLLRGSFDPEFAHRVLTALEDPTVQARIDEMLSSRETQLPAPIG